MSTSNPEVVLASIGDAARWRTAPWAVSALGVAACVFGVTSILLLIAQPLLFHAWCTLCLTSSVISLTLVGPAIDQVQASLHLLERVGADGGSRWRAFWGHGPASDSDRPEAPRQIAS